MKFQPDRRAFLKSTAAFLALAALGPGCASMPPMQFRAAPRRKKPATLCGAFFYPSADAVLAGRAEDQWAKHQWFTWPGNQFDPEAQQAKFTAKVRELAADLDLMLALEERPLQTEAAIQGFLSRVQACRPDALLLFNFWNSFSAKLKPLLAGFPGPIILYHPTGANHQLPPEYFRTAARVQYIHSIENWAALERGLRAVHARARMGQGRLLRVSGQVRQPDDAVEPLFGTAIHTIPTDEFNALFDEVRVTPEMDRLARSVLGRARHVREVTLAAARDAVRAHVAVQRIMERHDADAVTIECLMLKHRKPCLSFALNNGGLVPCGCENDLNASLTLMLGAALFGRGGFQHNPEFDTEQNLYFASHCTCATRLHGPAGREATYDVRPFFHQLPKTLALDVQWPAGEPATLFKYLSGQKVLHAWRGTVVGSPTCPPAGGCATRVLVKLDGVADVCSVYSGPHPVLYCGDFARHAKAFAQLYGLEIRTNC